MCLLTVKCSKLTLTEQTFVCGSVGTVLFTALGISFAAIALHGAFRQPDDLFTDEPEVCHVLSSLCLSSYMVLQQHMQNHF